MSKVLRLDKVEAETMVPHFTGEALEVHWVPEDITPNSYGCAGCGLVWSRRWQAETCEERGHVSQFDQRYGGRFENGVHKGFTAYTRYAIRRSKAARQD